MSARDQVRDLVDRVVDGLTRDCNCGDYGCHGRFVPRRDDPRVVALALKEVMVLLASECDPDLARAAAEYAVGARPAPAEHTPTPMFTESAAFTG